MSERAETFIGKKLDRASGQIMYCQWLVDRRYLWTWRALGHSVVRPATERDGSLPLKANGQHEWACPLNRAVKSRGKAVAVEAPPEEATTEVVGVGVSTAPAKPARKRRAKS